jgi:hypothetical protein
LLAWLASSLAWLACLLEWLASLLACRQGFEECFDPMQNISKFIEELFLFVL